MNARSKLTTTSLSVFKRDGVLVIPGFYDVHNDIRPIQYGIFQIIGQVLKRHGISMERTPFQGSNFDDCFESILKLDRSMCGEIYDAVKQIPAFLRLLADRRHEDLFRALRPDSIPAIAGGGFGIRIDNPAEDKYRAHWHQEYPSQLRSLDGLVFWSPLVQMTENMGPVRVCLGSHLQGPIPVTTNRVNGQTGAYALRLSNEEEAIAGYRQSAPLASPGDLIVIDFLTIHASGFNRSERSRWSMQFRYFNFNDPTGMSHGWKGSFAAGINLADIHPELCAEQEP